MRRFLRFNDTFALFDLTMFQDEQGWVWVNISHVPELKGTRDGLRHLYQQMRLMERWAWQDGVVGWTCACDLKNLAMQRWVHAIGGKPYQIKNDVIYFAKQILTDPTPEAVTLQQFITGQKSVLHGRAAHG